MQILDAWQNPTFTFDKVHNPLRCHAKRHVNVQYPSIFCMWLRNALHATTARTFSTCQLPKAVRHRGVLHILTWKCASRSNVLHFSTSQRPKVLRPWCALYILTWTFVLRAISHLARWLRTRRFSEPTFRPSGVTNHWKNTALCDFATFLRTCIFCLMPLSLLWSSFFFSSLLFSFLLFSSLLWLFAPLLFHLSIIRSEVWLLNFLRQDRTWRLQPNPFLYMPLLAHLENSCGPCVLDQIIQASWEILRPWLNLECVECVFVSSRALVIKMVYRSSCGCFETCRDCQVLQHRAQRHSLWPAWPHEPFWNFKFLATRGI